MSADNFENIRIKGVASDRIAKSSDEPLQYTIPFLLSNTPSPNWINLFNKEWREIKGQLAQKQPLRDAEIVGNALVVTIDYNVIAADPFNRFNFDVPLENLKG